MTVNSRQNAGAYNHPPQPVPGHYKLTHHRRTRCQPVAGAGGSTGRPRQTGGLGAVYRRW